ncbi:MAG: hypothetical protein ACR2RL_26270 [Gammaproteobacteria bacterium]
MQSERPPQPTYDEIERAAVAAGLRLRGGFAVEDADAVPALDDGHSAKTLIVLGNAGPEMWRAFSASRLGEGDNPLDRWSAELISNLAAHLRGLALFPFGGPPFLPFIRWAQRAEAVYPSPMGPLIHPDHGLWHAYRGAIAFSHTMALPPRDTRPSPCDTCQERPCLTACPAGAFTGAAYDVPACVTHVSSAAGVSCLTGGCLARHACPVGTGHAYAPAQAEFHMRAFLKSRASSR